MPDPASVAFAIRGYRDLLVSFARGMLDTRQFAEEYPAAYLANDERNSAQVFDLVDAFFADVDAYVDDPSQLDRLAGDLDEDDLRSRAGQSLAASGYVIPVDEGRLRGPRRDRRCKE